MFLCNYTIALRYICVNIFLYRGHGFSLFLFREISGIELVILALLGDQLVVGAPFDDPSKLHNHDTVGVLDRGQTVGDDKGGTSLHQRAHAGLHQFLGTGIDGGCSLIQNQRGRIRNRCPGDGEKLPLALA